MATTSPDASLVLLVPDAALTIRAGEQVVDLTSLAAGQSEVVLPIPGISSNTTINLLRVLPGTLVSASVQITPNQPLSGDLTYSFSLGGVPTTPADLVVPQGGPDTATLILTAANTVLTPTVVSISLDVGVNIASGDAFMTLVWA